MTSFVWANLRPMSSSPMGEDSGVRILILSSKKNCCRNRRELSDDITTRSYAMILSVGIQLNIKLTSSCVLKSWCRWWFGYIGQSTVTCLHLQRKATLSTWIMIKALITSVRLGHHRTAREPKKKIENWVGAKNIHLVLNWFGQLVSRQTSNANLKEQWDDWLKQKLIHPVHTTAGVWIQSHVYRPACQMPSTSYSSESKPSPVWNDQRRCFHLAPGAPCQSTGQAEAPDM